MGLRIGDAVSTVAATRLAQLGNRTRVNPPAQDEGERAATRQAGFGENTASPANLALDAIDQTVRRAADLVPSVDDLRQEFAERSAIRAEVAAEAAAERAAEADSRETLPEPQRVRPEPSPQARNYAVPSEVPSENLAGNGTSAERPRVGISPATPRIDVFA